MIRQGQGIQTGCHMGWKSCSSLYIYRTSWAWKFHMDFLSQHISLKNLHLFLNWFHFILFYHPLYFTHFPHFTQLVLGGGLKCHLELSQDVCAVPLAVNCTFPQAGVSSISPALAKEPQGFPAASPVQKPVLGAVWLCRMLCPLPTTQGHLDLNGLAMHPWNNPDHIPLAFCLLQNRLWAISHLSLLH